MAVTSGLRPIFNLCRRIQPAVSCCSRFNSSSAPDSNILKSPLGEIEIPRITISELIFSRTEKWGSHIATECAITGRKYTYDDLHKHTYNLAGALRKKLKLNKGDVVAVLMPNSPEYAIVAMGIVHGGMVATTLNPIYTPDEISRQLLDSGAKVLITLTTLWSVAKAAVGLTGQSLPILTANTKEGQSTPQGAINLKEIVQEKVDISDISLPKPDDIAFMPYSSGTTGLPKGVLLTHSNIVSNILQMSVPKVDYLQAATKDTQDVVPIILPQFHIYGLVVTTLLTLSKGCKHVCMPKFEPKLFINTLIKHKPNLLFVAPPLVLFITTHDAVKPEYLSPVRNILSGAAPLGASDEERFQAKAKKNIVIGQGYGMTETSPVVALTTKDKRSPPGSTGYPVPNTEIKIAEIGNQSGPSLGPNQTGELMVRGPQVMQGYHNKPEATKDTLVDGWLRTGDIAFYDDSGNLTITDRLKELIKVKGFQVPPAELEEVIREYPDVLEVGVIGIPHDLYGQVPRAYVAVKPGTEFNKAKLQDFVKSKVASYKELKGGISIVDSIPKNQSGKILRRELQQYYEKNEM